MPVASEYGHAFGAGGEASSVSTPSQLRINSDFLTFTPLILTTLNFRAYTEAFHPENKFCHIAQFL